MKKFYCLLAALLCVAPLWGSIAPKPEMDFTFIYQTENKPTIVAEISEQIQCEDNQCLQNDPLGQYGLQKLYCDTDSCFSIAYEYWPFQQLVLNFSDGVTRTSNVFAAPKKLRSAFNVIVRKDDLVVEPTVTPSGINELLRADAWLSLLIILLTEILAAIAYLSYTGKSYRVLYAVVIANLITMPLSWQVLAPMVPEPWFIWLFCFLFETLFIWLCNRKYVSLRNAAALSVAINVTSYSMGIILSFLIAPYLF